jgi:hypothetical protein
VVHERFGPNGFFGIVRDETNRAMITTLGHARISIDHLLADDQDKMRGAATRGRRLGDAATVSN